MLEVAVDIHHYGKQFAKRNPRDFTRRRDTFMKFCMILLIPTMLIMPQIASAQGPVVSQDELKQALLNASRTRKENLDQVRSFLSSDLSREAFKTAHVDSERVQKAVSSLDDTELSKLADQTRHMQSD